MRQNFGLLLSTVGSIFLGINVFRWGYDSNWKELPWLERWFYKLFGDKSPLEKAMKRDEEIPAMMKNKVATRPWRKERRLLIWAFLLILTGFLFSLDYRALSRFWDYIF